MRRFITVCFTIILLFIFAKTALAANRTYTLDKLNLQISLPDDWEVITPETSANHPLFSELNIDFTAFMNTMKNNNVMLSAFQITPLLQFDVMMIEDRQSDSIYDFNSLGATEIKAQAESIYQQDLGSAEFGDYILYNHAQARFIQYPLIKEANSVKVYSILDITVINGHMITLALSAFNTPLTEAQKQTFNSIVDKLFFTKVTKKPEPTMQPLLNNSHANSSSKYPDEYFHTGFISLLLSMIAYSLIPCMLAITRKTPMDKKELKKIIIFNALIVFIISVLITMITYASAIAYFSSGLSALLLSIFYYFMLKVKFIYSVSVPGLDGVSPAVIQANPLNKYNTTTMHTAEITTNFCPYCGVNVKPDELFCRQCGSSLDADH